MLIPIKLIRTLFKMSYKTEIMPFWPRCYKIQAILSRKVRPGHRAGAFMGKLYPSYGDLGRKTQISVTGLAQPLK